MINNIMIGHEFLLREFGVTPKIGWELGSRGQSEANKRIYADLGYEATFEANVHASIIGDREVNQAMDYIYRP